MGEIVKANDIKKKLEDSDMIVIGIGEEFEGKDAVEAYNKLGSLLVGKNYYIVSLCMNDSILQSTLDNERIIKPLGGYSKKQCVEACTNDLYDVEAAVCPKCGKELVFNNIEAENYVEAGYLDKWVAYKKWLSFSLRKRITFVELGVTLRFPQIVRWPFEKTVMLNNQASLIRVNEKFWQIPTEISKSASCVKMNAYDWLIQL